MSKSARQNEKMKQQLGIPHGTARNRLHKQIMWNLISELGYTKCFRCGKEMAVDNYSIEHIEPWLDSHDPVGLFFDYGNITFSHFSCNVRAARRDREHLSNMLSGTRSPNSSLTSVEVAEIRALYSTREWTQRELANRFDVSQNTIGRVVRCESYT